jgi:hypothetical protein
MTVTTRITKEEDQSLANKTHTPSLSPSLTLIMQQLAHKECHQNVVGTIDNVIGLVVRTVGMIIMLLNFEIGSLLNDANRFIHPQIKKAKF